MLARQHLNQTSSGWVPPGSQSGTAPHTYTSLTACCRLTCMQIVGDGFCEDVALRRRALDLAFTGMMREAAEQERSRVRLNKLSSTGATAAAAAAAAVNGTAAGLSAQQQQAAGAGVGGAAGRGSDGGGGKGEEEAVLSQQ